MKLPKHKTVAAVIFLVISGGIVTMAAAQQQSDVVAQAAPAPPTTAPFDAKTAREAILLRFMSLQNFSVAYRVETENLFVGNRGAPALPGARRGGGIPDTPREILLSRLGEKLRIEERGAQMQVRRATGPSGVTGISIYTGDFDQELKIVSGGGINDISGTIQPSSDGSISPTIDLVEYALGLGKGLTNYSRLTTADLELAEIVPGPDGRVLMNLLIDEQKNTIQWEFRPDLSYAQSVYRHLLGAEKQLYIEVVAENFKQVQGLMLPFTVQSHRWAGRSGQSIETQRNRATITQYKLNDPENTDARYQMQWPAGAKVTDMRTQTEFIAGEDGKLGPAGK